MPDYDSTPEDHDAWESSLAHEWWISLTPSQQERVVRSFCNETRLDQVIQQRNLTYKTWGHSRHILAERCNSVWP